MKPIKSARSSRMTHRVQIVDVQITPDQRKYLQNIADITEIPFDDVLAVLVALLVLRRNRK
jgi:hypothetical protein